MKFHENRKVMQYTKRAACRVACGWFSQPIDCGENYYDENCGDTRQCCPRCGQSVEMIIGRVVEINKIVGRWWSFRRVQRSYEFLRGTEEGTRDI